MSFCATVASTDAASEQNKIKGRAGRGGEKILLLRERRLRSSEQTTMVFCGKKATETSSKSDNLQQLKTTCPRWAVSDRIKHLITTTNQDERKTTEMFGSPTPETLISFNMLLCLSETRLLRRFGHGAVMTQHVESSHQTGLKERTASLVQHC